VVSKLKHYSIYEAWNTDRRDVSEYLTANGVDYMMNSTGDLSQIPHHLRKSQQTPIFCVYKVCIPDEMATYISLAIPGVAVKIRPDQHR
jgi:hypothetical protein